MSWQISGSYFESCNCEAICPCRSIDGRAGGRSTYGVCAGVLTWAIEDGADGPTGLGGLNVAIAMRYSDDEHGSPWTWRLYVDERATAAQHQALVGIFSAGLAHLPWVRKPSTLVGVTSAAIELDHTPRRQWARIRDVVSVRVRGAYDGPETVTCAIPGHHRSGEELIAEELVVCDDPLLFDYAGNCGYASTFEYVSPAS